MSCQDLHRRNSELSQLRRRSDASMRQSSCVHAPVAVAVAVPVAVGVAAVGLLLLLLWLRRWPWPWPWPWPWLLFA